MVKATASRFGGVSVVAAGGGVRAEVEFWLIADQTKHGRFSTVVPAAQAGSNNQVSSYLKTQLAIYLTTTYPPTTFSSGDIMLFGF